MTTSSNMDADLRLANARLVLPDRVVQGAVVVERGLIVGVEEGRAIPAGAADLDGDYLMPGLVELHTDNLEKHLMPRPGVLWPAWSAVVAHDAQMVAAGITTVLDAICIGDGPGRDWRAIADAGLPALDRARADRALRADHLLHLRCEVTDPDLPALFARYRTAGPLRMVSLMDHTPGQRQFTDVASYVRFQSRYGVGEAEVMEAVALSRSRQARYADDHRRTLAEACVAAGIALASHDDETPDHVAEAVRLGITLSEFPTTLAAAQAARAAGMATVMGAPNVVRGRSHSGNVSALDLARAKLLDILSSDYMPPSLLHAVSRLVEVRCMDLPAAVATASLAPARAIGLTDRGAIQTGMLGDLVHITPTPDGPLVRQVWRRGTRVF